MKYFANRKKTYKQTYKHGQKHDHLRLVVNDKHSWDNKK